MEQQRSLNAADAVAESTGKATAANNGYAESERKVGREIGSTISRRLKEDAAIRALQGDLLGVRAAGTFLSMIPGLGAAVASTFELIGAAAVIGIGVELVGKVRAAIKAFQDMPKAIRTAFTALTESQATANDSLLQTNESLQAQIDKIEHKPHNGLKDVLDETKRSADELASSLTNTTNKLAALIKENQVGFFKGLILGSDTTTSVDQQAQNYADATATRAGQLEDLRAKSALETSKGKGGSKSEIAAFQSQIAAIRTQQTQADEVFQKTLADEIATRSSKDKKYQIVVPGEARGTSQIQQTDYAGRYGDQTRVLAKLRGYENYSDLQLEADTASADTPALQGSLKRLQGNQQGAAYQNLADRKKLQGFQTQAEDMESNGNLGPDQIYSFWQSKISAFRKGSEEYLSVVRSANEAYRQVSELNAEAVRSASQPGALQPVVKGYFGQSAVTNTSSVTPTDESKGLSGSEVMRQDAQAAQQYLSVIGRVSKASQDQALAMRQANLEIAVQAGTISRSGAAAEQASLYGDIWR